MSSHSRQGSHGGSHAGSQRGSQRGSQHGSPPRPSQQGASPFPPSMGFDPARDGPVMTETDFVGKRVDLPMEAYALNKETRFTARRGFNKEGKPIKMGLNIFPVNILPKKDIYQYDIDVSPNPHMNKGLVKAVWMSRLVQSKIQQVGGLWVFDGHKLAWSSEPIPNGTGRFTVDLDKENNQEPRKGRNGVFFIVIKQTKVVRMKYLHAYLTQQASWDEHVLECMNFLDHVMRMGPSENLVSIKRNFYSDETNRRPLCAYLEVIKGTYAAFRMSSNISNRGTGLMVNVDVSNTAFWCQERLSKTALAMIQDHDRKWYHTDFRRAGEMLRPVTQNDKGAPCYEMSAAMRLLVRLHKLKFRINHRGKIGQTKVYTVKQIMFDPKYGKLGAVPKNVTFKKKIINKDTGETQFKESTVWDHYVKEYDCYLERENWPLLETTKGAYFPLELCNIIPYQRYHPKLTPDQTSKMIKIAAVRPRERKADIDQGMNHMNWGQDRYLRGFGIDIGRQMVQSDARLLKNPNLTFANGKIDPGMSGRWDLRGKQFIEPHPEALKSWSMVNLGQACQKGELEAFSRTFCQTFRGHGGKIDKPPILLSYNPEVMEYGDIAEQAYKATGTAFKSTPQIIFFILENKNQYTYDRLKKSMDCRWCVMSQMLHGAHIKKNNAQYSSNVAMKVNAKMGGATCRILKPNDPATAFSPYFPVPTMIIGADVSHASPGSSQQSMAAMCISLDKWATKYVANCETNGYRVEIIQPDIMQMLFPKHLANWCKQYNGNSPQHVYYFRDGVAEGMFADVINVEVEEVKRAFRMAQKPEPKITVIIATKRHHIRFFPKPGDKSVGDRNNNPYPGTLVERDATHPFHNDFYLCSHAAIQGTARPVHYQIIHDEANVDPNMLQKMIYEHCYQYARSTTPVSLFPAVYYAHLASQRARSHENMASDQKELPREALPAGKKGFPLGKTDSDRYPEEERATRPRYLLPMGGAESRPESRFAINTRMWFI